jgi:O-antigen ligase
MPEHFRALVFIFAFAGFAFLLAKKPLTAFAVPEADFVRRRNMWFGITLLAFLAHNFLIFLVVAAAVLLYVGRNERNLLALYAILMFAIPPFSAKLSGLGLINQLLVIDYARVLSIAILLPAALRARRELQGEPSKLFIADVLVVGFVVTQLGLRLTIDSATNTFRYGVYAFLDILLPYYVASRALRTVQAFREVLVSFVCAALVMAIIAMFEAARYWLPYTSLMHPLGVQWSLGAYLSRGSFLRAQVTTGQPIVLGYIMVVALAAYVYLRRSIPSKAMWWLGFVGLCGGLIATFSRGPWMAAIGAVLLFRFTTPRAVGGFMKIAVGVGVVGALVLASPIGEQVVEYLPFIGSIETENVTYRQHLLEVSIKLILQHPWFGSFDYIYALQDAELVIGGMVDIVNTYIGIGLSNGLVGLGCFAGAFIFTCLAIWRCMYAMPDKEDEQHTLGSGLLACIVGIMVTIFTVSSISFIPMVYWMVLGLGVGYVRMARRRAEQGEPVVDVAPAPLRGYASRVGARAS